MEQTNYVKEIITDEEVLSKDRATEINPASEGKLTQEITLALKKTMEANNLISLTAPQIGYDRRVMCLKVDNTYKTFINPVYQIVSANEGKNALGLNREKCTSLPSREFIRPRYDKIIVFYVTPLGQPTSIQVSGAVSALFQHCIDHLDGLLLSFIGLEVDEQFDKASKEEQQEVIDMYMDSLDLKHKVLVDEINNDEDLKQTYDAIRFMEGVRDGTVKLARDELKKEPTVKPKIHKKSKSKLFK